MLSGKDDEALLALKNISFSYKMRKGDRLLIFDNLSLNIMFAEFVGIAGPSGCGKSTLLRMMAGLLKPDSGEIYFRGRPLNGPDPRISMVFQNPTLLPWYTIIKNVMLGLINERELTEKEKEEKARTFLDMMGLIGFENAYPAELSGGMKQRVAIARALVSHPDLLLMDEPFSNLDQLTAITLRRELENLWLNQALPISSIVLVSHDIEELVEISDRVIVLTVRPTKVAGIVKIDLKRPRSRRSQEFYEYVDQIYTLLS
ncbi:MAG: ABC transporter ATP-binding protein [Nitrososphaerota archaeon]